MTKTDHKWRRLPGNFDTTKTRLGIMPGDPRWGLPVVSAHRGDPPEDLIAVIDAKRADCLPGVWPHFFLDDYRFERFWNGPPRTLWEIERWGVTLGPDFSIIEGHPKPVHLWNLYRNRWLSAWWALQGIQVIPTVGWAGVASWDYSFAGISEGGWIAVSALGVKDDESRILWRAGLEEAVKRLRPAGLVEYGQQEDTAAICSRHGVPLVSFPSRWTKIRHGSREAVIAALWEELRGVPEGTIRDAMLAKGSASAETTAALLQVSVEVVRVVWRLWRFDTERQRVMG